MLSGFNCVDVPYRGFLVTMIRADGHAKIESYVRSYDGRMERIGEVAYQTSR